MPVHLTYCVELLYVLYASLLPIGRPYGKHSSSRLFSSYQYHVPVGTQHVLLAHSILPPNLPYGTYSSSLYFLLPISRSCWNTPTYPAGSFYSTTRTSYAAIPLFRYYSINTQFPFFNPYIHLIRRPYLRGAYASSSTHQIPLGHIQNQLCQ
jgi:hypothetical protein